MSLELNGNLPSGESHPEGDVMPQNSLHVAQVGAEETTDRGLLHQSLCCRAIPRESCWPMGVSEHHALKEHNASRLVGVKKKSSFVSMYINSRKRLYQD